MGSEIYLHFAFCILHFLQLFDAIHSVELRELGEDIIVLLSLFEFQCQHRAKAHARCGSLFSEFDIGHADIAAFEPIDKAVEHIGRVELNVDIHSLRSCDDEILKFR